MPHDVHICARVISKGLCVRETEIEGSDREREEGWREIDVCEGERKYFL